jgi:hypothetical protein
MFNLFATQGAKQIHRRASSFNTYVAKRGIKLHEYQAGNLLAQYRVPIIRGQVAFNAKEAKMVAR